jgi:glutathione S-transferase/nicotinamidase-related amidase
MPPALIIIDLQNDFISPEGILKKDHIPPNEILSHLKRVCAAFKDKKHPIVTVRSEYIVNEAEQKDSGRPVRYLQLPPGDKYRDVRMNDEFLSSTHLGRRKFCVPGSEGANFPQAVEDLIDEFSDLVITKNWYSAFTETKLHAWLQGKEVGNGPLYFAGVTANGCVMASATDAFFLGYQVNCVLDCIGGLNRKKAKSAFKRIEKYCGMTISSNEAIEQAEDPSRQQHFKRILYLVNGSIPSWRVMMALSHKDLSYVRKRLLVLAKPRETRAPEFAAVNPRCKTPTFIDEDGTLLIESMAILQYLETYYQDSGEGVLVPNPQKEKAKHALTLQRFHESENLHYVFDDIELLLKHDDLSGSILKAVCDAYRGTLKELSLLEPYLAETAFFAGVTFSLADCAYYPCLAYCVHRGLDLTEEGFPNLARYYNEVFQIECAKDACPLKWNVPGKINLFEKAKELTKQMDEWAAMKAEEEE